ncbi:MAG: hypothetical protein PVH88_27325 [Ignavibacteria bacterium]|jgi:hypothetical protein
MFSKLRTLFPVFFLFLFFSCKSPTETPTEEPSDLYVLESDVVFGGYRDVDVYHNTIIINTSPDSILLNVESPTPSGLKRESIRSPSFGSYFSLAYSDYYYIPDISKNYRTTEPDTSTSESHFWNNLRLGPSERVMVPYSNYLGEGEELFIQSLGVNNFSGLEVTSEYKIERDEENSSYLNLEIKQTMENTTEENMYVVVISLHVPKELRTRTIDTIYYRIISDTMLTDVKKSAYYRDTGTIDGFGLGSIGQNVDIQLDVLRPDESFDFTIKMTIEPLLDKFEIYPSSIISFYTKGERIWPKSIITYNGEEYNGNVGYLELCNLAIPTYILFSINNGELKVVSPDEIEPTFSPID